MNIAELSRAALDWPALLAELAARAQSDAGRAACPALPLHARPPPIRGGTWRPSTRLAAILRRGEPLPGLRRACPRWTGCSPPPKRGPCSGPEEVRPVAELCVVAEGVRRFVDRFVDDAGARGRAPTPELDARAGRPSTPGRRLRACSARRSTRRARSRDSASPVLAGLRRERGQLADGARAAIEALMRTPEFANVLQDCYVTVREERYVLPIKANAKSTGAPASCTTRRARARRSTSSPCRSSPPTTASRSPSSRSAPSRAASSRSSRRASPRRRPRCARRPRRSSRSTSSRRPAALGVAYGGVCVTLVDAPLVDLRRARHPACSRCARPANWFPLVANDVALGGDVPARLLVVRRPEHGRQDRAAQDRGPLGAARARRAPRARRRPAHAWASSPRSAGRHR